LTIQILILAFALMLIFEGIGPLLFPNRWRAYMTRLSNENPQVVRQLGVVLVAAGALLFYCFI
jgi:uncharacterized protein YjeT (DUF2065 family)